MNRTPFGCLLVFCFFGSAHAQVPRPESRTVLTGDSLPVANRLRALDRQIAPLESVPAAAKFIAQSAAGPLWSPIVGLLLEDAATDKWNRTLDELQKIFDDSGDARVEVVHRTGADETIDELLVVRRVGGRWSVAGADNSTYGNTYDLP